MSRRHRRKLSFFFFFVGGNFSGITEWNYCVITEINFVFTVKNLLTNRASISFSLNNFFGHNIRSINYAKSIHKKSITELHKVIRNVLGLHVLTNLCRR